MEISLLEPGNGMLGIQGRLLSSYLKMHGHRTKIILLPLHLTGWKDLARIPSYSVEVLDELKRVVKSSDLIGFSVWTNFFLQSVQITRHLKSLEIPIIWGGIHPTVRPDECLDYADMVCLGEGENPILELANSLESRDPHVHGIQNIWFMKGREIIRNDVRPPEQILDKYPPQDWSLEENYGLISERIVRLTDENIQEWLRPRGIIDYDGNMIHVYYTMFSRGCPFACTYCCNNALHRICRGKGPIVRRRSVNHFIHELLEIKARHPFFKHIAIVDDCFLAAPDEVIQEFSERYKREVDMPFRCVTHLAFINERKMDYLVKAGLYGLEVGVESGSERTRQEVYNRMETNKRILEVAKIINKFRDYVIPRYDFIINNPWETLEDLLETARLMNELPKPYVRSVFSLTFFPGTELHDRALREGLLRDEVAEVYTRSYVSEEALGNWRNMTYPMLLINFAPHISPKVMRRLLRLMVARILNVRAFQPLYGLTYLVAMKRHFNPIPRLLRTIFRTTPWREAKSGYKHRFDA